MQGAWHSTNVKMGHDQAFHTITWHLIIETVPLFSTGQPSGLSPENQHQYLNTINEYYILYEMYTLILYNCIIHDHH